MACLTAALLWDTSRRPVACALVILRDAGSERAKEVPRLPWILDVLQFGERVGWVVTGVDKNLIV